jgi:hypothetical protein
MFQKVSVVAGIMMMASVSAANAADASGRFRMYMSYSCGAYADARRGDTHLGNALEARVGGWISGVNWHDPSGDILNGSDLDGAFVWLDNYCQQNPLDKFNDAAKRLVRELEAKQQGGRQ